MSALDQISHCNIEVLENPRWLCAHMYKSNHLIIQWEYLLFGTTTIIIILHFWSYIRLENPLLLSRCGMPLCLVSSFAESFWYGRGVLHQYDIQCHLLFGFTHCCIFLLRCNFFFIKVKLLVFYNVQTTFNEQGAFELREFLHVHHPQIPSMISYYLYECLTLSCFLRFYRNKARQHFFSRKTYFKCITKCCLNQN